MHGGTFWKPAKGGGRVCLTPETSSAFSTWYVTSCSGWRTWSASSRPRRNPGENEGKTLTFLLRALWSGFISFDRMSADWLSAGTCHLWSCSWTITRASRPRSTLVTTASPPASSSASLCWHASTTHQRRWGTSPPVHLNISVLKTSYPCKGK